MCWLLSTRDVKSHFPCRKNASINLQEEVGFEFDLVSTVGQLKKREDSVPSMGKSLNLDTENAVDLAYNEETGWDRLQGSHLWFMKRMTPMKNLICPPDTTTKGFFCHRYFNQHYFNKSNFTI
jgi:hypothetical protein